MNMTLEVKSKFGIGDKVFVLSANDRRIEKGEIVLIKFPELTISKSVNINSVQEWQISYYVRNLSRAGDYNSFPSNMVFATYEEAKERRRLRTQQVYSNKRAKVAVAIRDLLDNVNRNDLSERDKKLYDALKDFKKEERL